VAIVSPVLLVHGLPLLFAEYFTAFAPLVPDIDMLYIYIQLCSM
jgi:hypothetical protein